MTKDEVLIVKKEIEEARCQKLKTPSPLHYSTPSNERQTRKKYALLSEPSKELQQERNMPFLVNHQGYKRSERPVFGVPIAAPATAGIYMILSPLDKEYAYDIPIDNEGVRQALVLTGFVLCAFGLLYGGYWRIRMRKMVKFEDAAGIRNGSN